MNKMKFQQAIKCGLVADLIKGEDVWIVREYNRLCFFSEDLVEMGAYTIPVDHPFGYKRIECNGELIYTVVHSKVDESNKGFGDPDYAEIVAFKFNDGEKWRRELAGWNIGVNFGGIHLIGDKLVAIERRKDLYFLIVLDSKTGRLLSEKNIYKCLSQSTNRAGGNSAMVFNEILMLSKSTGGVLMAQIKTNEIEIADFEQDLVLFMDESNENAFFLNSEHTLVKLNKSETQSVDRIKVNSLSSINNFTISNDGNFGVVLDEDNCSVTCFESKSGEVIWNYKSDNFEIPIQAKIYRNKYLFLVSMSQSSTLKIFNIRSGELLDEVEKELGIDSPFFLIMDKLFIKTGGALEVYKLTDDENYPL